MASILSTYTVSLTPYEQHVVCQSPLRFVPDPYGACVLTLAKMRDLRDALQNPPAEGESYRDAIVRERLFNQITEILTND